MTPLLTLAVIPIPFTDDDYHYTPEEFYFAKEGLFVGYAWDGPVYERSDIQLWDPTPAPLHSLIETCRGHFYYRKKVEAPGTEFAEIVWGTMLETEKLNHHRWMCHRRNCSTCTQPNIWLEQVILLERDQRLTFVCPQHGHLPTFEIRHETRRLLKKIRATDPHDLYRRRYGLDAARARDGYRGGICTLGLEITSDNLRHG